jgi:hypothetical protein
MRMLMNRKTATSLIPAPPTEAEMNLAMKRTGSHSDNYFPTPDQVVLEKPSQITDDFHGFLISLFLRWRFRRFTFDWDGDFDDEYNQYASQFVVKTFRQAVGAREYGVIVLPRDGFQLFTMVHKQFKTLKKSYQAALKKNQLRVQSVDNSDGKGKRIVAIVKRKETDEIVTSCRRYIIIVMKGETERTVCLVPTLLYRSLLYHLQDRELTLASAAARMPASVGACRTLRDCRGSR